MFAGSKWLKDFSFSMNLSELWSFFLMIQERLPRKFSVAAANEDDKTQSNVKYN